MTQILAHRGASAYRPENTLEAFALAIELGADGIELDVHLSRDGGVIVAHDERLERVSDGTGYIHEHTLAELKQLNFGKNFPDLPRARVPTLDEVYALIAPTRLTVNVELKTTEFFYPGLAAKCDALAVKYGIRDRILYSSFNHYSLLEIRAVNPSARIGLLYAMGIVDPWVYANYLHANAIHPHYAIVAALPEAVTRCREAGVEVNVWTADDPQVLAYMYKLGVNAVITNKPDVAFAVRGETERG